MTEEQKELLFLVFDYFHDHVCIEDFVDEAVELGVPIRAVWDWVMADFRDEPEAFRAFVERVVFSDKRQDNEKR
jgi:hypothetical protein